MVAHTYNSSPEMWERGRSGVQEQPWLQNEFEDSMAYRDIVSKMMEEEKEKERRNKREKDGETDQVLKHLPLQT